MMMSERISAIWLRLKALFKRRELYRDLDDELQFHLAMREQKLREQGVAAEEAPYAARRQFGNVTLIKEVTRDMWGLRWLEEFLQDLRYGARQFWRTPGFTGAVLLILTLGIGPNTTIFSLIDAIMLKRLPIRNPSQLILVTTTNTQGETDNFTYPPYVRISDQSQTFSEFCASHDILFDLTTPDQRDWRVQGELVSGSYFSVLGVNAILGRTLSSNDDRIPGGHPVAMIGYGLWRSAFNLDPSVLGRSITLNGQAFTIIGVAPADFFGVRVGRDVQIWIPMMMQAQVMPGWSFLGKDAEMASWLDVMGRLKPRITVGEARSELNLLYKQHLSERVGTMTDPQERREFLKQRILLSPGGRGISELRERFSQTLLVLMAIGGLVLLITCANIASLLLARCEARQREIAVRLALGADRLRVVRQLLTESTLLAVIGGTFGVLFAFWASNLFVGLLPIGNDPIVLNIRPDYRILGFATASSLLTVFIFGLTPAFQATRLDLASALKKRQTAGALGEGYSRRRRRFSPQAILVISQIAFSLVALIGGGLFVRTLQNLRTLYPGFDREHVLTVFIYPRASGYSPDQLKILYHQLLERIASVPGVRSVTLSGDSLVSRNGSYGSVACCVSLKGYSPRQGEDRKVGINQVTPAYFATMGMRLLVGRDFSLRDTAGTPKVAVINETMARRYFPGEDPIGKEFTFGEPGHPTPIEVIGVVQDARYISLREQPHPFVYLSLFQSNDAYHANVLAVRTVGDPIGMAGVLRQEVKAIAKNLPIENVKSLSQQVQETLIPERVVAMLASLFGLLALMLTCVGLYGLVAYGATRRVNEIGIRMALGARQQDVLWMVLKETLVVVLIGLSMGLPTALAATRLIGNMLYGLSPTDLPAISIATLVMVIVAGIAGYIPARRASRVDPMVALRYE